MGNASYSDSMADLPLQMPQSMPDAVYKLSPHPLKKQQYHQHIAKYGIHLSLYLYTPFLRYYPDTIRPVPSHMPVPVGHLPCFRLVFPSSVHHYNKSNIQNIFLPFRLIFLPAAGIHSTDPHDHNTVSDLYSLHNSDP